MIDLVKKAMFTGIGIMSLTKDKIDEVAQDFVEKGKLSEEEGTKFVEELLHKSDASKKALKEQVESMVQHSMKKMDVASNKEISELKEELAEVKKMLATAQEKTS